MEMNEFNDMPKIKEASGLKKHRTRSVKFEKHKTHQKRKESCLVRWEGAAEGGADDWGEVVTR